MSQLGTIFKTYSTADLLSDTLSSNTTKYSECVRKVKITFQVFPRIFYGSLFFTLIRKNSPRQEVRYRKRLFRIHWISKLWGATTLVYLWAFQILNLEFRHKLRKFVRLSKYVHIPVKQRRVAGHREVNYRLFCIGIFWVLFDQHICGLFGYSTLISESNSGNSLHSFGTDVLYRIAPSFTRLASGKGISGEFWIISFCVLLHAHICGLFG